MPAIRPTAPESATTALYRAALGPVNTAHHLPAFDRFDAAGRASPVWNWAAGLLTLNWMLFRQLWGAALVYLACAGGLLLLILGPLRDWWLWPQWPPGVQWGAVGTLVLLSIVLPGAFGPAILHADTRRRITRAVRQASTVREACATLERQASTRRRLWGLVALNGLLALAVLALVLWLRPGTLSTVAADTVVTPPIQAAPAAPAPVEVAPAEVAETPPAVAVAPPVAELAQDAEIHRVSMPPAEPGGAAPPPPVPEVSAVAAAATSSATPVPAPKPVAAPAARATPSSSASASAPGELPQAHGINVGLFADRANAEKAQSRLVEAGLPAILQTTESAKGTPLTRVRVGPLASRAQAEDAAERIRAMGLEARVFAPGGG